MNNILISVIIPVYNVEKYIDECMESIIVQIEEEYEDSIEIILVNDGSTDSSGLICNKYAEKYPFCKVFHKENEGLLATRRFGYRMSRGEYLLNIDSDDGIEPNMIKELMQIAKDMKYEVVIFNANTLTNGNKSNFFENIFTSCDRSEPTQKEVITEFLSSYSIVSMWCKLIRRDVLDIGHDYSAFGKFQNGEDSLQSVRIYARAHSYLYLNRSLYIYRLENGMTRRVDWNYYRTFKKVFEEIESVLYEKNICMDEFVQYKFFYMVGRSITQLRGNKEIVYPKVLEYLSEISDDQYFISNIKYYKKIKKKLSYKYRFFIRLLLMKRYKLIYRILSY